MTAATLPPQTERAFMEQVCQLAQLRGWSWLHIRAGRTRDSWRTPISGPLGKGWPDLTLIRVRDGRVVFAELKADGAKLTPDQVAVLTTLKEVEETYVWHPADWDKIEEVLR